MVISSSGLVLSHYSRQWLNSRQCEFVLDPAQPAILTLDRAPTAAGQYHWVSMLAPPSCRTFLAYITGWLVISGWMGILAGSGFLGGQQIAALATLNNPGYAYQRWQVTLIFWLMVIVSILINTVVASVLPKIESLVLIIHVLGFFAVLIPLVYVRSPCWSFAAAMTDEISSWHRKKYQLMMSSPPSTTVGTGLRMVCRSLSVSWATSLPCSAVTAPSIWRRKLRTLMSLFLGVCWAQHFSTARSASVWSLQCSL